jgi:hypothetical protein
VPFPRRRTRALLTAAIASVAAAATLPAAANAGLVVTSGSCDDSAVSQPFVPWVDVARYTLNGGGSFESGAVGWNLFGASVVDGNEPWKVTGNRGDDSALSLPPGSSAVSAVQCVGIEHPTLRFFAKRSGGGLLGALSSLQVSVLVETELGPVAALPVGVVVGDGSWLPTAPLPVLANLLPLLPGDHTPVAFFFTPLGTATWQVDDVYVDPWGKG